MRFSVHTGRACYKTEASDNRIAAFEQSNELANLVFWEAKLFSNKELRDLNGGVLHQIAEYGIVLNRYRDIILHNYKRVAEALVSIAAMSNGGRQTSSIIDHVAGGRVKLHMSSPPTVGLIVFGFDAFQKAEAPWKTVLETQLKTSFARRGARKDFVI